MLPIKKPTKPEGCNGCNLYECKKIPPETKYNIDILFIMGFPVERDISRGAFTSSSGMLVRKMIKEATKHLSKNKQLKVAYTFAVQCQPKNSKILMEDIFSCRWFLLSTIDRLKPKMIIPLGADAVRSLGYPQRSGPSRGNFYDWQAGDTKAIVMPTMHPFAIIKSPGYTGVFRSDIDKAILYLTEGIDELEMNLKTPTNFEEIITELDKALEHIQKNKQETGKQLMLTVDVETTGLRAYDLDQKIIAISISYEEDQGLSFPWRHSQILFNEEELKQLRDKVNLVIGSEDIVLGFHNAKFDLQWLMLRENFKLAEVAWDTLLGEHHLDEDKKGEYGLKELGQDYFPGTGRYEEELKEHLGKINQERAEVYKNQKEKYREALRLNYSEYWAGLSDDIQRTKKALWINQGYITIEEATKAVVKYTKRGDGTKLTKKSQTDIYRILRKISDEELREVGDITAIDEPTEPPAATFEDVPIDTMLVYSAIDPLITRKILRRQSERMNDDTTRIKSIEKLTGKKIPTPPLRKTMRVLALPTMHVLAEMEYGGITIDRDKCRNYISILDEALGNIRQELIQLTGLPEFNPQSGDLAKYLYGKGPGQLGLPVIKYTDKGAASTDAETLKQLYDDYDSKILQHVLTERRFVKCRSTYLVNWLNMSERDGKLHCNFNQNGTATYRLSSSSPNLQTIPFFLKEANLNLKAVFIPDSDDYELYDLDISNAEMRVLCAYSLDEALIEAFKQGKDLHCLTGAGISDYSYVDLMKHKEEKESKEHDIRQIGKKVNFGTIFCMTAGKLQEQLWSDLRIRISEAKAQEYLNKFFETYPGVRQYINTTSAFAAIHGFTYTFTGRRRRFPLTKYQKGQASRAARQAVNARIQTTSSDLVCDNLVQIDARIVKPRHGRTLLQVHDAIVFQLPKGEEGVKADLDRIVVDEIAERYPWMPVSWAYNVGKGPSYGEAKYEVN